MKFASLLFVLVLASEAVADSPTTHRFYDARGHYAGRATTYAPRGSSPGQTTFYDARGSYAGRATTYGKQPASTAKTPARK